jgi:hypothetical protein
MIRGIPELETERMWLRRDIRLLGASKLVGANGALPEAGNDVNGYGGPLSVLKHLVSAATLGIRSSGRR